MYIVLRFGKQMEFMLQLLNIVKDDFKITKCASKNVLYSSEHLDD